MELLLLIVDFVLHIDHYIASFVQTYGIWVYLLLFLIVFVETGLVVMPLLPGDSLLFVVGTLCGAEMLNLPLSLLLLSLAAVAGDQTNYLIGQRLGSRVWQIDSKFFNRQAFERAHSFYQRYGGITVVVARFMPFVRTFAPFVAGVANMNRVSFSLYNLAGGLLWVLGIVLAGYAFGNIDWVQQHLEKIIWGLILIPSAMAIAGAMKTRGR